MQNQQQAFDGFCWVFRNGSHQRGWRKDAVHSNPPLVPALFLMWLIMWINLTATSWICTSTKAVTPVPLHWTLSLIMHQLPVTHHVSASCCLGNTVIWALAITTSLTDVTWERSLWPKALFSPSLSMGASHTLESRVKISRTKWKRNVLMESTGLWWKPKVS